MSPISTLIDLVEVSVFVSVFTFFGFSAITLSPITELIVCVLALLLLESSPSKASLIPVMSESLITCPSLMFAPRFAIVSLLPSAEHALSHEPWHDPLQCPWHVLEQEVHEPEQEVHEVQVFLHPVLHDPEQPPLHVLEQPPEQDVQPEQLP